MLITLKGYRVKAQSGVNNVTSMNTAQFKVIVQKGYRISKSITGLVSYYRHNNFTKVFPKTTITSISGFR